MDQLALIYETSTIVGSNALRSQLMLEIEHYHHVNNTTKRDELLESITDAEMGYLVDRGILQEAWGTPSQRGGWQAAKDKVAGAFGGQESGTRNKLVELYKKVWTEYVQYVKGLSQHNQRQKGLGGGSPNQAIGTMTPESIVDFLMGFGFDPKIINQLSKDFGFQQDDDATTLAKKDVGNILYKALQLRYQSAQGQKPAQYKPSFQLPPSL